MQPMSDVIIDAVIDNPFLHRPMFGQFSNYGLPFFTGGQMFGQEEKRRSLGEVFEECIEEFSRDALIDGFEEYMEILKGMQSYIDRNCRRL